MERALERADQILIESRDRVKDLRSSSEPKDDLAALLAEYGKQMQHEQPVEFSVAVEGTPLPLHDVLREEAWMIGREAITNAFRHAGARAIEVEIAFRPTELSLRVRDDGHGVEPTVLDAGGRAGHWGLQGMRERARKINSHLEIWSRTGLGTEVQLRVPAAMAYRDGSNGRRWSWLRGGYDSLSRVPQRTMRDDGGR